MRWCFLLFMGGILLISACSKLEEKGVPENLVPLTAIPAEYGELVTVTLIPENTGPPRWYEMWFENEDTGQVTYIPVYRHNWKYVPEMVRVFERSGAPISSGGE